MTAGTTTKAVNNFNSEIVVERPSPGAGKRQGQKKLSGCQGVRPEGKGVDVRDLCDEQRKVQIHFLRERSRRGEVDEEWIPLV